MPRPKPDRKLLLTALCAHVLEHGLNDASLRPMAKAAGTSDRMLIYHFGSKESLVAELLKHLADQMALGLDAAMPAVRLTSERELVEQVAAMMRSPAFQPYVRVWLDIVAAASQGQTFHREVGADIIETYLEWIAKRHPEGRDGAPRALTLIEGLIVMDAIGHQETADLAISSLREN